MTRSERNNGYVMARMCQLAVAMAETRVPASMLSSGSAFAFTPHMPG
jgi:hypothetical protein